MQGVAATFDSRTFFITGCTGFVGGLVLEQLLHTSQPTAIHVLIRGKRGRSAKDRLAALLGSPVLAGARAVAAARGVDLSQIVHLFEGDLLELDRLPQDTEVVLHAAADIRFDLPIQETLAVDCQAADRLAAAAAALPHLAAFVHVSTAYANANLARGSRVEEKIYGLPDPRGGQGELSHAAACALVERLAQLPAREAEKEATTLRKMWGFPNNYCLAKSLAERMLAHRAATGRLPLAIVRPSIITGTSTRHALPGYVGNAAGGTGFYLGMAVGLIRVSGAGPDSVLDFIPGDYVSSAVHLAAAHLVCSGSGAGGATSPPADGDGNCISCGGTAWQAFRVLHVASTGTHPITGGAVYSIFARQIAARWPPTFSLRRSPPPPDLRTIYFPPGWRYRLRLLATDARVSAASLLMKLACQAGVGRRLKSSWKSYKQVSDHSCDFNLTFDSTQLQRLGAATQGAPDAAAFTCVWGLEDDWEACLLPYTEFMWQRYLTHAGGSSRTQHHHSMPSKLSSDKLSQASGSTPSC